MTRPQNWVFLGDSLTEGIGSMRATYVTELVKLLREPAGRRRAVHDLRLRDVDPLTFNRYLQVNLAGFLDADSEPHDEALWIWNLASEGRTIDTDRLWLPWLKNLRPERIFIYRGSLESIIRPAAVRDGAWPVWVPRSWRGFVAMDPRCYFSTTVLRHVKQASVDALKQRARLRLLASRPGRPLYDADTVLTHYQRLLSELRVLDASIHVLGLIPPDPSRFPGSAEYFKALNGRLRALAQSAGVRFVDWAVDVDTCRGEGPWRYRDGFHPNLDGARMLAVILRDRVIGAAP